MSFKYQPNHEETEAAANAIFLVADTLNIEQARILAKTALIAAARARGNIVITDPAVVETDTIRRCAETAGKLNKAGHVIATMIRSIPRKYGE
jgi:hypothetical protein